MSETPRLKLPLLMPSQAQKHVTMNESLFRLDALTQLTLVSRRTSEPGEDVVEGDCYSVPESALGVWKGQDSAIAIHVNGGWDFVMPAEGWRAYIMDEGLSVLWRSGTWQVESSGDSIGITRRSFDHQVAAGSSSLVAGAFAEGSVVIGITGRVKEAITGSCSTFKVGVPESPDRYGTGIGVGEGAWLRGLTSSPLAYWSETPLLLSADNGVFSGVGTVSLHIFTLELPLP